MVCISTVEAQRENFEKHREEILSSEYRFAIVYPDNIKYYKDRESLYKELPEFSPDTKLFFGTLPLLIDIGQKIDSLEYRKEKLEQEKEECDKNLIGLVKKRDELEKIKKQLSLEEKARKKAVI